MFGIILLVLLGIAAGYALRRMELQRHIDSTMSWTIRLMLFVLGLSVGGNPSIINNLGDFGGQALLICCAGIVGSILFCVLVARMFFKEGGRK